MAEIKDYEIELRGAWSGALIDEISDICTSRKWSVTRNGIETLDFVMDLDAFEQRMAELGEDPYVVMKPYTVDFVVVKKGIKKFGVHLYDRQYSLDVDGKQVNVKADGFINLFKDRFATKIYGPQSMTAIAWDLIDSTQSIGVDDDFGVTLGPDQYTTADRERTYDDKNIKDAIIQQTDIIGSEYDFQFTWDKKFNTYEHLGSDRPDIILTYPEIITSLGVPDSAIGTFNKIRALGSGMGEEKLVSIAEDPTSKTEFKTREKPVLYNDISVQETLDEHAARDLSQAKDVIQIPSITLPGTALDLNDVWLGDRIRVVIKDTPSLPVDGMYRIEKISVTLDDNDVETITLDLDNYGL